MNETYTDLEYDFKDDPRGRDPKRNNIDEVIQTVARAFNIQYGSENVYIRVRLPRKKIEQISKDLVMEFGKTATIIDNRDINILETTFTKFTTPQGTIEFIDNGE